MWAPGTASRAARAGSRCRSEHSPVGAFAVPLDGVPPRWPAREPAEQDAGGVAVLLDDRRVGEQPVVLVLEAPGLRGGGVELSHEAALDGGQVATASAVQSAGMAGTSGGPVGESPGWQPPARFGDADDAPAYGRPAARHPESARLGTGSGAMLWPGHPATGRPRP